MGGGISQLRSVKEEDFESLVQLLMPDYYINDVFVIEDDIVLARASWKRILNDDSDEFKSLKNGPSEFSSPSCLTWFYDVFYLRLFDVNPSARPFFKGTNMQAQGRVLCGVISTALNQLKSPEGFVQLLTKLTHVHSERGIRGMQYGIIGEVLFWSLKHCLGDSYDERTNQAWIKIFSYMLKIIVPVSLADEINELNMIRKGIIPAYLQQTQTSHSSIHDALCKTHQVSPNSTKLSTKTLPGDSKSTNSTPASTMRVALSSRVAQLSTRVANTIGVNNKVRTSKSSMRDLKDFDVDKSLKTFESQSSIRINAASDSKDTSGATTNATNSDTVAPGSCPMSRKYVSDVLPSTATNTKTTAGCPMGRSTSFSVLSSTFQASRSVISPLRTNVTTKANIVTVKPKQARELQSSLPPQQQRDTDSLQSKETNIPLVSPTINTNKSVGPISPKIISKPVEIMSAHVEEAKSDSKRYTSTSQLTKDQEDEEIETFDTGHGIISNRHKPTWSTAVPKGQWI